MKAEGRKKQEDRKEEGSVGELTLMKRELGKKQLGIGRGGRLRNVCWNIHVERVGDT